ncbi:MAG TPA: SDR family oxidoreductase [Chitinophagaceae bacterium]|nr:SDR family oxidoreductase [Chitinophagaceae bacterium]
MKATDYFKDQVVWITGASSGIGEALVYAFALRGALLIISSRNKADLEKVKENCKIPAEKIFVLPVDLSQPDLIAEKSGNAMAQWGRIDYVIHNAGIASRSLVQETEMKVFRMIMETNYFGTVAITRAVLPSMLRNKKGHFVVISSLSGKFGVPKLSAYAASKHALHGFFDSLRTEIAGKGIDISIIIPGFINTQIITRSVDGDGNVRGRNLDINEKGMSAEQCAQKIVAAVERKKQEIVIGGSEVWSVFINRYFPRGFNRLMGRHPIKNLKKILFRK